MKNGNTEKKEDKLDVLFRMQAGLDGYIQLRFRLFHFLGRYAVAHDLVYLLAYRKQALAHGVRQGGV